jgi:structure-specific endonuclease subunit SLX1
MSWVVYCLATTAEPINTYIGATVNPDKRLAQHNRELSGGAKATGVRGGGVRGGEWYRVCYVSGFLDNHQALSFEWHWKWFSKKQNGDPLTRRRKGLDKCLEWFKGKFSDVSLEIFYE